MICTCGSMSVLEIEQTFKDGKTHIKQSCQSCGKFLKWAPHVSDEEFTMPFGQYKGELLGQIDKSYLQWLYESKETANSLKKRIEKFI
jgi:hypothetical protein